MIQGNMKHLNSKESTAKEEKTYFKKTYRWSSRSLWKGIKHIS